jgi:hypothetical protein
LRFAYATDRSGAYEIWLRNRQDGSEGLIAGQKDFLGGANVLLDCAISPDGGRIAYRRNNAGSLEIFISPISGETPVRLWEDPAHVPQRGPSWSPDGNWIAYYSSREGKMAVLKARVGSGTPPELVAYMSAPRPVRWSPRGDWIAFNDLDGLHVASPDGKQNVVVSRHEWYTFGWSREGAQLFGIACTEAQRLALLSVEVASRKEKQVADLGRQPAAFEFANFDGSLPYRGFSLHPDGKSFLTSIYRLKSDIWLLEDFDRSIRPLNAWWDGYKSTPKK